MTEIIAEKPLGIEGTPLYGVAQVRELTGLARIDILYLLRLGLVNPIRVAERGKSGRKFSELQVEVFEKARDLKDKGASPREIVASLGPESSGTTLLTELEDQVIRMRYGGRYRRTIESIAQELGLAKQTTQEVKESGIEKLARAYIIRENLSSQG